MSAAPALQRHPLVLHPASPGGPVRELSVSAGRDGSCLLLRYRLVGDLDSLLLPAPRQPERVDELWRHTCFEAFIGRVGTTEYVEFNLSPSGQWAGYRFDDRRAGMRPLAMAVPPSLDMRRSSEAFELHATLDLRWIAMSPGGTVRLGVTAVIEDRAGVLSYWALKHPAEKPDFHHPDSFVLDL